MVMGKVNDAGNEAAPAAVRCLWVGVAPSACRENGAGPSTWVEIDISKIAELVTAGEEAEGLARPT